VRVKRRAPPEPTALVDGKITRIAAQRRNTNRFSIDLDGTFAFGLMQDVVAQAGLHVGMALGVADQRKLIEASAFIYARSVAIELLSFKPRTESELRGKLAERGFSAEVVDDAVVRFKEIGYIDDARYVAAFVRDRLGIRGHGQRRIARDLQTRGVSAELIQQGLAGVDDGQAAVAARAAADKVLSRMRRVVEPVRRRQKVQEHLARRGFSGDVIRAATSEMDFAPPQEPADPDATPTTSTECPPAKPARVRPERVVPSTEDAMALARKRWPQLERLEPSEHRRKQKLQDFLKRRSVPYDVVRGIVDALMAESAVEAERVAEEAAADAAVVAEARAAAGEPPPEPVEVVDEDARLFDEALDLARGRWRRLEKLEPNMRKRRQKLQDFLGRRGFRFDVIRRVLDDEALA